MFALVDVNNFYASCERLFRPDLQHTPIIVLSNNDGCVIARSNEAKELGIGMAAPYFQIKHLCDKHQVKVFSSNYTLYGDLSQRVMSTIESCCPDIEIYSIDEAFLDLSGFCHRNLVDFGLQIHQKVSRHIGIPVSIGIGPTKTLAKIANHIAKRELKQPVFDISCSSEQLHWLNKVEIDDIWGIGRQYAKKLKAQGIRTAMDLKSANVATLRRQFGVIMERTIRELNGVACTGLESAEPRQAIMSSKSFGKSQTELEDIAEALSSYCARACQKLRNQGSATGHISVFLRTNPFQENQRQYSNSVSINLPSPTDDTRKIIGLAKHCLMRIYRKGYAYQKTGILLSNLQPKGQQQIDMFNTNPETFNTRSEKLMEILDQANHKFGQGTLRVASEGFKKSWQMQSSYRSPRYTTCWNDLAQVRCAIT